MNNRKKFRQIGRRLADFCKRYSTWIIVLLCALLFDTLSTIYAMGIIGIDHEIHPMTRYSALFFGPIVGTFLVTFLYRAVVSVLLATYLKRLRIFILIAPTITSTIAGFLNLTLNH